MHWVIMAGAGVKPEAGDFVLSGEPVTGRQVTAWAQKDIAGVAVPAGASIPRESAIPVIVLPEKTSLREVQRAALELIVNRQAYLVERGAQLHQRLARLSVEGEGLEQLAQAMFEVTGKTVLVQDKRLRALALAVAPALKDSWQPVADALTHMSHLPDGLRDRRQAAALGGWRDQSLPHGLQRLVCPIVAKGMARGYLSVIGAAGELDALDQLVVEHGAAACALEMAKAKAVSDAEKRSLGDFMDAVFTSSLPPDELHRWAQRLNIEVDNPHAALICRWIEDSAAPTLRRLETIVNQSIAQTGVNALARPRGNEMVVFCAVVEADHPDAVLKLATVIRKAAHDEYPQFPMYVGVGRPAEDLGSWKESYKEAGQTLSMAVRLKEQQPLYFGDLSVYRLLFQLKDNSELEMFCRETLGPLLDYEGGGDLLETLEAFCERLGNLSQTAEKLFIHRNSLLYRMERIQQLAGLDMNNPDTRLAVHLALKIRKMLKPKVKSEK